MAAYSIDARSHALLATYKAISYGRMKARMTFLLFFYSRLYGRDHLKP
jgi:hypothetical protein